MIQSGQHLSVELAVNYSVQDNTVLLSYW